MKALLAVHKYPVQLADTLVLSQVWGWHAMNQLLIGNLRIHNLYHMVLQWDHHHKHHPLIHNCNNQC